MNQQTVPHKHTAQKRGGGSDTGCNKDEPEDMMLRETNQTQKNHHCRILLLQGPQFRDRSGGGWEVLGRQAGS